jgi:hypothetical protein
MPVAKRDTRNRIWVVLVCLAECQIRWRQKINITNYIIISDTDIVLVIYINLIDSMQEGVVLNPTILPRALALRLP